MHGQRPIHPNETAVMRAARIRQARVKAASRGNTPRDRIEIAKFYAEAREKTKRTGVPHHVDHIIPLVAGGRHHWRNLRVVKAAINLARSWSGNTPKPVRRNHAGEIWAGHRRITLAYIMS